MKKRPLISSWLWTIASSILILFLIFAIQVGRDRRTQACITSANIESESHPIPGLSDPQFVLNGLDEWVEPEPNVPGYLYLKYLVQEPESRLIQVLGISTDDCRWHLYTPDSANWMMWLLHFQSVTHIRPASSSTNLSVELFLC